MCVLFSQAHQRSWSQPEKPGSWGRRGDTLHPQPPTGLADSQTDPKKAKVNRQTLRKPRSKRKPGIAGRLSTRAEKMFEITDCATALRDH